MTLPTRGRRLLRTGAAIAVVAATAFTVVRVQRRRRHDARQGCRRHRDLVDRPGRRGARSSSRGSPRSSTSCHPNVTIDVSSGCILHRGAAAEALRRLRQRHLPRHLLRLRLVGERARSLGPHARHHRAGRRPRRSEWDEFSEAARATVQPTGEKTIGFPAAGRQHLAHLQQEGVRRGRRRRTRPTNWTWDDFRDAAKKLTDPSTETYGYAYSVSGSRGDHLAVLAAPVAERRRDPRATTRRRRPSPREAGVDALDLPARDGRRRQERLPRPDRHEVRAAVRRRPHRHDDVRARGSCTT